MIGCSLAFTTSASEAEQAYYEAETHPPPPSPYVFSYTAGRFPGHADRTHSEVSDGSGIVRGSFSYVDPRQQIRTVDYTADQNGFHPILSHPPAAQEQSAAVKLATQRHLELYNRIAESHLNPQAVPQVYIILAQKVLRDLYFNVKHLFLQAANLPRDTASVAYAKEKHHNLFEKIAQDHERIGAEQLAKRLEFEATSEIPEHEHIH